jgi:hypothetical protein
MRNDVSQPGQGPLSHCPHCRWFHGGPLRCGLHGCDGCQQSESLESRWSAEQDRILAREIKLLAFVRNGLIAGAITIAIFAVVVVVLIVIGYA